MPEGRAHRAQNTTRWPQQHPYDHPDHYGDGPGDGRAARTVPIGTGNARHRLGRELRRLREARPMRLEDAAARLEVAPSTLSRIETGKAPTRISYLAVLLDLYGVDDPAQCTRLADLAREGRHQDWWADYGGLLPGGAGHYLGLETAASHVSCFAAQAIPGLLQTAGYAATTWRATRPTLNAGQVRELVALTSRRQELMRRERRRLHVIIDESALVRSVAPAEVMAGQLEHLLAAVGPSVTVQVIRLASARPVLSPAFTVLALPDPADTGIACCAGLGGRIITTTRTAEVRAMHDTFTALAQAAMTPANSARLIKHLTRRGVAA